MNMEIVVKGLEGNLPLVATILGMSVSILLSLGLGYHLLKVRYLLALQKQRIESLENQMMSVWGGNLDLKGDVDAAISENAPEDADEAQLGPQLAAARESTREKVLQLHGLGRSNQEIAEETGIRSAEVDFLLKVNEHMRSPSGTVPLRKIS